ILSPLSIMAWVQRAISRRPMPRRKMAMARADICSSATTPRGYAAITQSLCSSARASPSRLVWITSTMSKGSTSAACSTALCWCPVSSVISDDLLDVVGPEGLRQDLFQAARPLGGQGGEPLGRVLGQQLAAPPAGHDHIPP